MRDFTGPIGLTSSPVEWESDGRDTPILAVAVHAGHRLRPEVRDLMALSDEERLLEEDPGTDVLARVAPVRGIAWRSRFEVDLNRPRDEAVHADPEAAWGLNLWKDPPGADVIARSLALHDRFYRQLAAKIDDAIRTHGSAILLDIHSYNHMRGERPKDPSGAPEINVGTGSLDARRWGYLEDGLIRDLTAQDVDARENVRFRGRRVAAFVHSRYPDSACCLALDFKKTYMDERSGTIDGTALTRLSGILALTLPGLEDRLSYVQDVAS